MRRNDWFTTGTTYYANEYDAMTDEMEFSESTLDKLVARMMEHTTKVILPCRYCGSHNAFSNPTCVKCGAPMGVSYA